MTMATTHTHTRPVRRRTVDFIRDLFRTRGLKPGDKLPPLKELAVLAEVSYVTVCKAMQEFRKDGLVTLVNNRTCMAGGSSSDPERTGPPVDSQDSVDSGHYRGSAPRAASVPSGPAPQMPWQRAAGRIREDIVNRAFPPGAPLPSVKELEARYRITYRTLRKALRFLVDQGILESLMNGGYAAPSFTPSRWRTRIVCLVRSLDSVTMTFGTNDEAAFRALEGLCEQAQIRLEIHLICVKDKVQLYRQRDTGRIRQEEELPRLDDDAVLGFAYFIPWQPSGHDQRAISSLATTGKAVAVLDESGMESLSPDVFSAKKVRIFSVATSPRHAESIAQNLLRLGHTRVAFISTDHGYTWSQRRLAQIIDVYTKAGLPDGVTPFVAATPWDSFERGAKRCDFGALYRSYASWRKHLAPPLRGDFDRHMEQMRSDACRRMESRLLLLPLLDRAANDRTITAWITATDDTATMALEVLKQRDIHVPRDLSLISFDDSPEAMRSNLSSYNFNAPALGAGILGFLVGRRPYADPEPEAEGFVVDRGSTAPAKRPS